MKLETKPKVMIWLDRYIQDYYIKNKTLPQSVEMHPYDVREIIANDEMRLYGNASVEYAFKHPEVLGVYKGVRLTANLKIPSFTREE